MPDIILFLIGVCVSGVVLAAVTLLVWGATQERYDGGRHVGHDLLRQAEEALEAKDDERQPRSGLRAIPRAPKSLNRDAVGA